jgi:hypothetical protein
MMARRANVGVPIVLAGLGCHPSPRQRRRAVGLGLLVGEQATNASQAVRSASDIQTGVGIGASVGGPWGAAIGAVAGAIGSLFGPAKEGQAALTWDDMVKNSYLFTTPGTGFDERYFGEALKGAMDEGNNIWPGCGSDGHKNPDCFYSVLARQIISGYQNGTVPLSTTDTNTVYNAVVVPWLASGASGMFNYPTFTQEATQNQALLIKAAVDRYLNGLPITRANMPSYGSQMSSYAQWSTPSLSSALAPMLAAVQAANAAPVQSSGTAPVVIQPLPTPPAPVIQSQPALATAATAGVVAAPAPISVGLSGGEIAVIVGVLAFFALRR